MKYLVKVLLVTVVSATWAFAQNFALYPNTVPKGAYVNGSDGDQQFIQTIKYTVGNAWTDVDGVPDITITLPDSMTVADWDNDAPAVYDDEVSVIGIGAAVAVTVGAAATQITLDVTGAGVPVANDVIEIIFPVETKSGASGSQNYGVSFAANTNETNGTITVSYVDTLAILTWAADYAGNDDQSGTKGDVYPATAASFFTGGYDIVRDLAAALVAGNAFFAGAALDGVNDNGEAATTIWASQTPGLKKVHGDNAHRPFDVTATPIRPADDDGAETVGAVGATPATYQLDGTLLEEGYWFFYITSSATGDWALAMSDTVDIRHWPTFASGTDVAGGYDYDEDGIYTAGGGGTGDDIDVTLESGGTLGKDGSLEAAGNDNMKSLDFFWDYEDVDDNASLTIFRSSDDGLGLSDVVTSGIWPYLVVDSIGANSEKINPTTIPEEGSTGKHTWTIYTDATTYEPAGTYYIYLVANDGKNQGAYQLLKTAGVGNPKTVTVKHYPYFEFDDVYGPEPVTIETSTDDYYVISWGKTIDGDLDADGNADITFYYTTSDLDAIATAASIEVTDGALLTDPAWTGVVTQIGSSVKEDPDTKEDNRYMWNVGAISPALAVATDHRVIAHIQEGDDHLFVQYTSDLGPKAALTDVILVDRDFQPAHSPYFRAGTPLEGETIVLNGEDEFSFNWSGFDRDDDIGDLVQVFIAPAGTDVATAIGGAGDWDALAAKDGGAADEIENWYWLFPTSDGVTSSGATDGPTIASGTYTLDVSDISDDMDELGNETVPRGFYDVWYFTTYDGSLGTETPAKADGVLRFTGSTAATTSFRLSPNSATLSKGDVLTVSVIAQSASALKVRMLAFSLDVPTDYFTVVDQGGGAPFVGENVNFNGSILENTMTTAGGYHQLNYVEKDDTPSEDLAAADLTVATFQIEATTSGSGTEFLDNIVMFVNTETRSTAIVDENGNTEASTIPDQAANYLTAPPGGISGQIALEIIDDVGKEVDIFVLPLGSFTAITDADFLAANGGANPDGSITDTLGTDGAYSVSSIPTGDYDILVHRDYHLQGLEENVQVRPVLNTAVNFLAANMLLAGDIAGYDHDGDGNAVTFELPDNQVATEDIQAVSDAFGATPDSSNWNVAADVNVDSLIYIQDYNVVVTNSGTNGEGLLYKAIDPNTLNENTIVRLIALSEAAGEVTYALEVEELSSLHAYAVEMTINADDWELVGFEDGLKAYHNAVPLHRVRAYDATFASAIIGRDMVRTDAMTLATLTLKAKVGSPEEISISEVSLVDGNGILTKAIIGGASESLPVEFSLSQNFPNPFNPVTTISFSLPDAGDVKLAVYNLLGQEIRTLATGNMEPGTYKTMWNSRDNFGKRVSTGMYFYRLVVDNQVIATRKMVLLK